MENPDLEHATPVTIDSAEHLRSVLTVYGVKTEVWDTPPYKNVNDLYHEIEAGESRIVHLGSQLGRLVSIANVDILAAIGTRRYQLVEDRQDFLRGGEIKSRRRELRWVSEKIKGDESPEAAARRGIKEELDVDYTGVLEPDGEPSAEWKQSSFSYPGLMSIYQKYRFKAHFGLDVWKPEGYFERQPDKITYFVWDELPS